MPTKPVHPFANSFPADDLASLGEQILYIRRAQREPMVGPDGVGHDLTRKTKALQARHLSWDLHDDRLNPTAADDRLAMPCRFIAAACLGSMPPRSGFLVLRARRQQC